jgi:hypothetical protein
MTGALYITDGTTRINLRTGIDGFWLDKWDPAIAGRKSTWRDSPLSDGRKPALMKWTNATETMSMKVGRFTQNAAIHDTQDLRRLLLAAEEYFLGGSDVPVWLEAKGDCETNTRYAVVVTWGTGNDSDPYHKPFDLDHPVMAPWTLILERQHWRDVAPGSSTCVQLSATQPGYVETSPAGYVPTQSADDCYVAFPLGTSISLVAVSGLFGKQAANSVGIGVRFRAVTIPNNATITMAYIEFESDANEVSDTCNAVIYGHDADTSTVFSTFADYVSRPRTKARTYWNAIAHWVLGTHYQTPDISPVIQSIVSRPGWVNGNTLTVFVEDNGSTANALRYPVEFDHGGGAHPPTLYVSYLTESTTFGRVATCTHEVYVANKHNIAQLAHIYHWTSPAGPFSANIIGAVPAPPGSVAFLPAAPAANDCVYFGSSIFASCNGPFCSLVFDIQTAEFDIAGISWEYWNGGWTALTVRDNTNTNGQMIGVAFDTTGVNSVHWQQPTDWVTTAINGITTYWVRARVVNPMVAPTPPTQQNRDIYTIVTPYIDTLATQIPGDIQALAQMKLEGQSGNTSTTLDQIKIYAGLRSYSRGSKFTSYLNFSDEQNPAGVTVTVNGGTATMVTDVTAPTGRAIRWTGAIAPEAWLAYITIPTVLVADFAGEFRSLLRYFISVAGAFSLKLKIALGDYQNVIWTSETIFSPAGSGHFQTLGFKKIILPNMVNDTGNVYENLILRIDGRAIAAVDVKFYDLILIPSDECLVVSNFIPATGISSSSVYSYLMYFQGYWKTLNIDSTNPRRMMITDVIDQTGNIIVPWEHRNNSPLIFQPNARQRWWFYQNQMNDDYPYLAASVQSWKVSRYLSMRGKR